MSYRNINPATISRMTESEKRRVYSELRSIARKRADRLEAAGYEAQRFESLNTLDRDDLDDELLEVAYYLNSPGSLLSVAKKEKEQATLAAHGYHIQDVRAFGRFMDNMRYRYKNRKMPPSDIYADLYEQAERRKMTEKTIQREFGAFLKNEDDARKLRDLLANAPERTKGSDRLTAANVSRIIGENWYDFLFK